MQMTLISFLMIFPSYGASIASSSSQGARFSKVPEPFRYSHFQFIGIHRQRVAYACNFLYKGNSVHIKNMRIKQQLCTSKVRDVSMAFRVRKVSGAFEKKAPAPRVQIQPIDQSKAKDDLVMQSSK